MSPSKPPARPSSRRARSVVTDGQGNYTIVDLRPGTYTVAFTLAGFATVRREGIELTSGFTANVNADLRVGSIEETVTVTGESPIVDTQSTTKLATASREVMDVLPTDRNFVSFAALTPSVLVTGVRQNVGGSIPETGMNLVVHGSRASDSLVTVEGMPIINGGGTGGLMYGNYLNNGLAQEITFQTDSHNAEFERATVYSNFIPKEGSNTFRGSFFGRVGGRVVAVGQSRRRADSPGPAERQPHRSDLGHQPERSAGRSSATVSGSTAAYRHWGTYNTVAGSFKDADFSDIFYHPTTEQNLFPVWHQSAVGALHDAGQSEEQVQRLHRLAVHLLRQLLRPDVSDGDQRLPRIQEHSAVHRAGELELAGHEQAAARGRRHDHAAGLPRLSPRRACRRRSSRSTIRLAPAGMPTDWGSSRPATAPTAATRSNYPRLGVAT